MPVFREPSRDIKASIQAARLNAGVSHEERAVSAPVTIAAEEWAMAQAKRILESAFSEIGKGKKQTRACTPLTTILEAAKAI